MAKPVEPRPVGPFPRPCFEARGKAMVGAWQRGFAARERLSTENVWANGHYWQAKDYHNPYSGWSRACSPEDGMTWGFHMAHCWRYGWEDADKMLRAGRVIAAAAVGAAA